MEKQVPENSLESQILGLKGKLLGHKIFGRFRGQEVSSPIVRAVSKILEESDNPSDFLKKWDSVVSDWRVLGNMMAVLKRDGQTEALEAFRNALIHPDYTFPGEDIPLEKTVPITLVVFDPERTFAMIRWILEGHPQELRRYISSPSLGNKDSPITKMFRLFPSLKDAARVRVRRHDPVGWELGYSYQTDVLRKFRVPKGFRPLCLRFSQYNKDFEISVPWDSMEFQFYNGDKVDCSAHFAFLVESDQKEVSSNFGRGDQKNIAMWQFKLHQESVRDMGPLVGLHLEKEHQTWRYREHTNASIGVSNGFGAIFWPDLKEYPAFSESCKIRKQPFRLILEGWPN